MMSEHMNKNIKIKEETLVYVLSKLFNKNIINANYQTKKLYGGTLGDVQLVTGTAKTDERKELPYNLVLKIQKKWERNYDHNSWRREYDMYVSDLDKSFTNSLRWPKCYHTVFNNDEIQIWMEYIDGVSGNDLTVDMLVQAVFELGRLQGRLYKQLDLFKHTDNLSDIDTMMNEYNIWYSQKDVFAYLKSDECKIPKHLQQMFFHMESNIENMFKDIKELPVVLCHKDFWIENIIYADGKIILIDWDCVGMGYLGEDIASLIIDETDTKCIIEYYNKFIPAYYKGFSEYVDISYIENNCVGDMILIKFGYRLVREYQYVKSDADKDERIIALQKIYDLMGRKI